MQRTGGYGSVLRPGPITQQEVKNLACRKSTGESGGIQASGACGPGLQGALGPGALEPLKPPGGSLAKAWVSAETAASEVGTWRETKPGYPPYPPPPHLTLHFGEKGRGFSHPLRLRQPSNTPPKVGGLLLLIVKLFLKPFNFLSPRLGLRRCSTAASP